jgi:hypothetical protein
MIKPINETIKTKGLLNMSIFNDFLKQKILELILKADFYLHIILILTFY